MPKKATALLQAWRRGDATALEQLVDLLYSELRGLARHAMRGQGGDHTLQPTALVHEAWIRMAGADGEYKGRAHFLAAAATVMRRILIDHARARSSDKRGGRRLRVTLDEGKLGATDRDELLDVIALDEALTRLSEESPRMGRGVELRFFGGLTYEEAAEVLEVSVGTVHRDLRIAQAWLHRELTA